MVAAVHMARMTEESRWRRLFEVQAARLLSGLEDTPRPLWTHDLYGAKDRFLGPVHGFAGNVIPLLLGWDWLTPAQQADVAAFVPKALDALLLDGGRFTWAAGPLTKRSNLCHGTGGLARPRAPVRLGLHRGRRAVSHHRCGLTSAVC
ncbi:MULTISPECIES: hypothetical protein [unclassified Bradyrhizobium]|uniref:hypothetical protein n=2 Tax=unclassified Bradyrhizobium TaxID=2631580 RepID=UPI002916BCF4|nr:MULTISPECIES: hypothetical protein [unclassified Bradyrhizobium]